MRGHQVALHVVPPIADEQLLVEHGAVGAEERILTAALLADVEDLPHSGGKSNKC